MSEQAALFDAPIGKPGQRSGLLADPASNSRGLVHEHSTDTERKAAALVAPRTGTLRARILEKLEIAGADGRTGYELQSELGDLLYSIAPRLTELRDAGWIVDSERRRETPSGADAIVWVLSSRGREELS
jgi:hypothetical protein